MRLLTIAPLILLLSVACSSQHNLSLTAPSAVPQTFSSSVPSSVSRVLNESDPLSTVIFTGLSNVLVTNRSGHSQTFAFVTSKVLDVTDVTGSSNQIKGQAYATLRAGETAELSFAFTEECDAFYQHAVWESGEIGQGRVYAPGGPYIRSTMPSCPVTGHSAPVEDGMEMLCHAQLIQGLYTQETLTVSHEIALRHYASHGQDYPGQCAQEIHPE